jgi:ribosomal protein S18
MSKKLLRGVSAMKKQKKTFTLYRDILQRKDSFLFEIKGQGQCRLCFYGFDDGIYVGEYNFVGALEGIYKIPDILFQKIKKEKRKDFYVFLEIKDLIMPFCLWNIECAIDVSNSDVIAEYILNSSTDEEFLNCTIESLMVDKLLDYKDVLSMKTFVTALKKIIKIFEGPSSATLTSC